MKFDFLKNDYRKRLSFLQERYNDLVAQKNKVIEESNGIVYRFRNPVLTKDHVPLHWRYDLNPQTNPLLLERIGVNSVFNPGAIRWNDRYVLVARIEGVDRKSFFALAESKNGIDGFRFRERPVRLPETSNPDINVYDMRLISHEDGWIYGIFCTERKDRTRPADTSAAVASAGIVRTKDLEKWERLPDLITGSKQQRNVVLHPEFVNGRYAIYTRPQDSFIDTGSGGGIGLGFIDNMDKPVVHDEVIIHAKAYHTVYELKNGLGPAPLKTRDGWLHLAHGVRNTAAGLRYVLYLFMTSLDDISKVIFQPAGYFMAPENGERVGDVSNVLFSSGWITDPAGHVYIYYASSDTRIHVALSTVDRLVDYIKNTAADRFRTGESVNRIIELIDRNKGYY